MPSHTVSSSSTSCEAAFKVPRGIPRNHTKCIATKFAAGSVFKVPQGIPRKERKCIMTNYVATYVFKVPRGIPVYKKRKINTECVSSSTFSTTKVNTSSNISLENSSQTVPVFKVPRLPSRKRYNAFIDSRRCLQSVRSQIKMHDERFPKDLLKSKPVRKEEFEVTSPNKLWPISEESDKENAADSV